MFPSPCAHVVRAPRSISKKLQSNPLAHLDSYWRKSAHWSCLTAHTFAFTCTWNDSQGSVRKHKHRSIPQKPIDSQVKCRVQGEWLTLLIKATVLPFEAEFLPDQYSSGLVALRPVCTACNSARACRACCSSAGDEVLYPEPRVIDAAQLSRMPYWQLQLCGVTFTGSCSRRSVDWSTVFFKFWRAMYTTTVFVSRVPPAFRRRTRDPDARTLSDVLPDVRCINYIIDSDNYWFHPLLLPL